MSVAEPQPAAPKPKLRWFQYSLRSLLLVMLLACLGMSWVAVKRQKARRQKAAVAAILKLGGQVRYDYQLDAAGKPIKASPPAATWWRELLGGDSFDRVVEVWVNSDAPLEHVEQLPDLESLILWCSPKVTNAGLVHLRGLPKLRKLRFGITSVTDAGLAHLSSLHQLESLDMWYLHTTDAGLEHLQGLTNLQELRLGSGQKTDAGLVYLKGLTQLRKLELHGGQFTEEGMAQLQQALPNCKIVR